MTKMHSTYRMLILFVALFGSSTCTWATVRNVDVAAGVDTGACDLAACQTIQYTVSQSLAGDTVRIAAGTYLENSITIAVDLNIVGEGALTTDIDAQGGGPIFAINANNVLIDKLTLRNGDAGVGSGGAIALNTGNLIILRSQLLDNRALVGGAIADSSNGQLLVLLSTLRGNTSSATGGAIACLSCGSFNASVDLIWTHVIENAAGSLGGALYVDQATGPVLVWLSGLTHNNADVGGAVHVAYSELHVLDSEVSNNEADNGDGGAIYDSGVVNIERSTLAFNTASASGGAVAAYGNAGLFSSNSTFSQNNALCAGGFYLQSNFGVGPTVVVGTATFYDNESTFPGCPQHISNGASTLEIYNSIIDSGLSIGGVVQPACIAAFPPTGGSTNRIVDTSCDTGAVDFNLGPVTGLDTRLGYNGGLTRTHTLIYRPFGLNPVVSNAIDTGKNAACLNPWTGAALVVDQRGKLRPVDHVPILLGGVPSCDIGAVELQ